MGRPGDAGIPEISFSLGMTEQEVRHVELVAGRGANLLISVWENF